MNESPAIACHGLSKTFNDAGKPLHVLREVNLSVARGEQVAIVGSSGSGKSTLLHLLAALDTPDSGQILLEGHDLTAANQKKKSELRSRHLGFVYQFHHLLPEFDALENVCMPLLIQGMKDSEAKERAFSLLTQVGLEHRTAHRVGELSGGERQRVAFARALVTHPSCILADEPTGNLDPEIAEQIYSVMLNLNQSLKTSFIVVTHDITLAQRFDRVLTMEKGRLQPCYSRLETASTK